jgi:hypothetical protein
LPNLLATLTVRLPLQVTTRNPSLRIDGIQETLYKLGARGDIRSASASTPGQHSTGTLSREHSLGGYNQEDRGFTLEQRTPHSGWEHGVGEQPSAPPSTFAAPVPPPSPPTRRVSERGIFDSSCVIRGAVNAELCGRMATHIDEKRHNADYVVSGEQRQTWTIDSGGWTLDQTHTRTVAWGKDEWATTAEGLDCLYEVATFNLDQTAWMLGVLFGEPVGCTPWENIRARYSAGQIHDNAVAISTGYICLFHNEST